MVTLTWRRAAAWRAARQHLDSRAPAGSMLAVASRLCGVHAQLMSSAGLTLWARVEDLDRGAVASALWKERTLVKTWAMRGTLHLLPADDLPLWHAALETSSRYVKPALWEKHFGITQDELDTLTEAIGVALDGQVMTRDELAREVGRLTGAPAFAAKLAQGSWGTILKPAAFSGRLCFGPSLGPRVRFTRPDTWLAGVRRRTRKRQPIAPHTVTAAVARRFLAAYGPATPRDLGRWWGGSAELRTARQWIASLGDEVRSVDVDGTEAWMLAGDVREALEHRAARSVRLLPAFDQYIVAASCHAGRLLPGDLRARVYRPQGWISPVLLVDGRMAGVWRHTIVNSRVDVVVEPFVTTPAWVRRRASQEAERLAAFLGGRLTFEWKE